MNGKALVELTKSKININQVFNNPGGGLSKVKSKSEKGICYIRGNSAIYLNYVDIEDAYNVFKGKGCNTIDLKSFRPNVFDSNQNGHGCNCTFLFLMLSYFNLTNGNIASSAKASQKPPGETWL